MMNSFAGIVLISFLSVVLGAWEEPLSSILLNRWESNAIPQAYKPNLVELASSLNLTKVVSAMKKTGLDHTVNHEGPFTFFAPTNAAFLRIPKFAKNVSLFKLLSYHIARAAVPKDSLRDELLVRSLLSKRDIRVNVYHNKIVTANGCKILKGPYEAFNGLLYVVDDVMWSVYEREGSVLSELERCPISHFDHMVQGLMLTGLGRLLNGKGPYTLLAPDDSAWNKLPTAVVDYLRHNATALREVLLNHILPGTLYSEGLLNGQKLKTMSGKKVTVTLQKEAVKFDEANVILADNTAGNGVIHAIDAVLHHCDE